VCTPGGGRVDGDDDDDIRATQQPPHHGGVIEQTGHLCAEGPCLACLLFGLLFVHLRGPRDGMYVPHVPYV
jgi:hypothetical protein